MAKPNCEKCIHKAVCDNYTKELSMAMNLKNIRATKCPYFKESGWISVEERLPEPETEVFITAIRNCFDGHKYNIVTTAMYEDGTVSTDDSIWNWYDLDFDYDEENDQYLIPEGWWEYRHYNPDDVYNNCVDDIVTHWMPLPEAPKEDK